MTIRLRMLTVLLGPVILLALVDLLPAANEAWRPAPVPLKTRWADEVTPANARPEYPRPQFVRSAWKNLNGLWEFAIDDFDKGRDEGWSSGKTLLYRILVPWTFEASLSGIGKGTQVHEHVWYRRTFEVPRDWAGKDVLLHFGAVDWDSTVWVNGHEVGKHRGGYTPFTCNITRALRPEGPQEVVVAVFDPADPKHGAYQPKGKQLGSHEIWYTRTTGIWQTVWIEPVAPTHLAGFHLQPDLEGAKLTITARVKNTTGEKLHAVVSLDGRTVAEGDVASNRLETRNGRDGTARLVLVLPIQNVRAWSPETPTLYDIGLTLEKDGQTLDTAKTYTGFRSVDIKNQRIRLNGQPYFLRGVLDQGFWPDGVYTPPTDAAIAYDVKMTRAFGLNLARKHVKIEDPRWYYYCDKLGLLVAQDMPSSHNLQSPEAKQNFEHEWREAIEDVRNHPSVILYIPFNENWGDPKEFQDHIVDVTHAVDPSRPVIDASGWTQREKTDITDIHDYSNNLKRHANPHPKRATWIGEYGGVALPVPGHTWVKGWGYQTVKTPEELLAKYKYLTDQINEAPGLSGFVYTQLTDVEQELNGLMTYDRIPKAPPERFAAINRREHGSAGR